jgi:hypothetical protein
MLPHSCVFATPWHGASIPVSQSACRPVRPRKTAPAPHIENITIDGHDLTVTLVYVPTPFGHMHRASVLLDDGRDLLAHAESEDEAFMTLLERVQEVL